MRLEDIRVFTEMARGASLKDSMLNIKKALRYLRPPRGRATSRVDRHAADQIRLIGAHPFLLVECRATKESPSEFVWLSEEGERTAFADRLKNLKQFESSNLLRGYERALRDEVYQAADMFFKWATRP